jgi:hypothetical protein
MSEQAQQESQENESQEQEQEQEQGSQEHDVQGVETDPDDGKKSIAVDTDERLEGRDDEPDFDEVPEEELNKEREERLAPENRPDTAEVDNSQRTFNPETGLFEDSDVDEPPGAPFATTEAEQSGSDDDSGSDGTDAAAEPKDREEATDAEQSKEAKESKDTEG